MSGIVSRRAAAAVLAAILSVGLAAAGEILSTMRNVNAVPEAHGYSIAPAYDVAVAPLPSDLSTGQAFEIIRPDGKPVTIGRLFTSCTCIQLQAHKRTFSPDERAILQLRNIRPTPANGAVYAIFVQITSPVRTTLRYDTFVQSLQPDMAAAAAAAASAAAGDAPAAEPAGVNTDLAAQITRQLEAVEAEHRDEDGEAKPAADPAATAAAPEAGAELRDELEAMLEREMAASRPAAEAVRGAVQDLARREDSGIGTADIVVDLNDGLPEFYAEGGAAAETRAPVAAAAPVAEPVAAAVPAPAPEPVPAAVPAPELAPAAVAAAPAAEPVPLPRPERDPAARKPVQAVSLITVGVRDMPASIRFYEALGWRRAARGKYDQTAFFQLQGQILALYPIADLLREQNMAGATPAPGGITLALHVQDRADVWSVYQRFIDAGGRSLRAPAEMASGAVSSYVADPDGNAWEISWVPQFRIDDDGGLWLP